MTMNTIRINRRGVGYLVVFLIISILLLNVIWTRNSNFSNKPPTIQFISDDIISSDEKYNLIQHGNNINSKSRSGRTDGSGGGGSGRNNANANIACQHPTLSLHNPDIDKFFKDVDPVKCDEKTKDWVITKKSNAYVTELAQSLYGPITCHFTELIRQDEYHTVSGKTVTIKQDEVYTFENSDYVEVKCTGKGRNDWKSYLAAPRQSLKETAEERRREALLNRPLNSKHSPLNILIWGQDSVSRLMFIRKLPQTWDYMTRYLHAIVLKGYNIVGDGTPQALTPILTGKTELELPEARSEMGDKAQHVDVYPWIWNEFKSKGYVTGFLEDQPTTGCFSHRHKGFDKTPTDFYMRIYFLAVDSFLYPILTKVFSYMWPNYCIANTPTHKVVINYFLNILQVFENIPKFLFAFRSEQSHHDINAIQAADLDLKEFMENLQVSEALNSSIFIMMSDHGARFQAIRESQQGKLEERLPAFMFVFPAWFSKLYPTAYKNFQTNADRLVTPFDIHRTLQDIPDIGYGLKDMDFLAPNELNVRGMSLFREIPPERTCKDADIEPHWCACLKEMQLDVKDELVTRAAREFVSMVNAMTETQRSLCTPLRLSKILNAVKLIPSQELLQFRHSADRDGRMPEMGDDTQVSNLILQLKVETSPGRGHFEVTMNYDRYKGKFLVKETDISRINKYGSQADCVAHRTELSYLRKYCFCKSTSTENTY